jgi:hypothetical protein
LCAIAIIVARDAALAKNQGVRRWIPLVTHALLTKLGVGWGLGGSHFFGDTLIYLEEAISVEGIE